MNHLTKIAAWLRSEAVAFIAVLRMVPAILDECRWARDVAYYPGPARTDHLGEPRSHSEFWPMTYAANQAKPATSVVPMKKREPKQ